MLLRRISAPWEITIVAGATLLVWWLALGWNWSAAFAGDQPAGVGSRPGWNWPVVAVAVATGVGWLARRGHGVAGTFAIFVPVVLLSGWRLADSGVVAWPINLASLVFVLCLVCIVAGAGGAWLRHRAGRPPAGDEPLVAPAGSIDEMPRDGAGSAAGS